ncbi:MAG: hypothetical protein ABI616_11990 [Pseudomonadota bacterium]
MIRRQFMFWVAMFLAAAAQAAPRSVLDRSTGATIVVSEQPWTLSLEQPQLAANSRDYIALYAVEVNIAGKIRHLLAAFYWSTVPGRSGFAGTTPELVLRVEDRQLLLKPLGQTPRDVGISKWPLDPPGRGAQLVIYEVDTGLLGQLGRASGCQARINNDPTTPVDVWYEVWRDGRAAFKAFAGR